VLSPPPPPPPPPGVGLGEAGAPRDVLEEVCVSRGARGSFEQLSLRPTLAVAVT